MIKKILTIICSLVLMLTLASCGKYSKFYEEIDALTIESGFPDALSGAVSLDEVTESVRQQQIALCIAYDEAYSMTVADLFSEKYGRINEDRMVSELSKTRNRLNNESDKLFTENLELLLTDVEDCPNVEAYIEKRIEEVKGFYTDYIELQKLDEDDFEDVTAIFLSYADSRNELAKWALKQKELLVSECATRSIEKNAAVTVGHAASLSRNNEIVTALNSIFGGVRGDTDHMERIKTANKKLTEYVAKLTTNAKTRERLMEELKMYGN